jgi:hypothetical protein
MFSFVGLCKWSILCSSLGDFRHRGCIELHLIFLFGGIVVLCGCRYI